MAAGGAARRWARACVTGRFQPLHLDHLELLLWAAGAARELVVGITNPDPAARGAVPESPHRHTPDANPFTFYERATLIRAALLDAGLAAERFLVVPFSLRLPETWPHYVPLDAVQVVRATSDWERTKAGELRAGGYAVELLEGDPATRRTATSVRASLSAGDGAWRAHVPAVTVPLIEALLSARDLAARTA